jgi:hypothetical protein
VPQPSTPTTARAKTPKPSDADTRTRVQLRPRAAVTVTSGAAIGLVPSIAAWLGADVALHLGRARVGATVGHAFARPTGSADEIGARVRLTTGGLLGCFAPSWKKVSLAVCGLAELGAMHATGRGPGVQPAAKRSLWVGLGVRTGIEWAPVRWFALVAQVDVLAGVRRPGFHVVNGDGDPQRVFRAAPAALRLTGGVSFRFP